MSHLLRRTKKSCLKLLRKISTSRQLFVQRLDEDEEYEAQEMEREEETDDNSTNDKQYECHNNSNSNSNPDLSVQSVQSVLQSPIDIQFDLMHYKENVRYLRHTPSNSSMDLQLEQQQQQRQQRERDLASSTPRACSVSVGSQFDGNYHNVIIMEQPPNEDYPIVKWDINGNSLDEEQFDLRQHWDAFDSRWRQLQSVPAAAKRLGSGHSHSQRSSHHSSSCTLETWIDDAELGYGDDSQNLLQSGSKNNSHNNNTNNNNNNCNHCLKSF